MKGYVSHLITENEKLEQELMADYDAAHAPVSHQQLLALQLRGDIDELSVCIVDMCLVGACDLSGLVRLGASISKESAKTSSSPTQKDHEEDNDDLALEASRR